MEQEWLRGPKLNMLKYLPKYRRQDIQHMRIHDHKPRNNAILPAEVIGVSRRMLSRIGDIDGLDPLDNRTRLLLPLARVPQVEDSSYSVCAEGGFSGFGYGYRDGGAVGEITAEGWAGEGAEVRDPGGGYEGGLGYDAGDDVG